MPAAPKIDSPEIKTGSHKSLVRMRRFDSGEIKVSNSLCVESGFIGNFCRRGGFFLTGGKAFATFV